MLKARALNSESKLGTQLFTLHTCKAVAIHDQTIELLEANNTLNMLPAPKETENLVVIIQCVLRQRNMT